jgi:cytoskeletal protein CcmA (bactofilin family)
MCLLIWVALSAFAFAEGSHEHTQFGHNITVGPNEEITEATCFGCSIRVRGHVAGDVTAFGGNVVIEDQGEVGGDTTTFGGSIRLNNEAKVNGGVTVFGGQIHRDVAVTVGGDVTNMSGPGWILLIFVLPLVLLGLFLTLVVWLIRRLLRPAVHPLTA